jgi:hypothetical protein
MKDSHKHSSGRELAEFDVKNPQYKVYDNKSASSYATTLNQAAPCVRGPPLNELDIELCRISLRMDNIEANVKTISSNGSLPLHLKTLLYHCNLTMSNLYFVYTKITGYNLHLSQKYPEEYNKLYTRLSSLIYNLECARYSFMNVSEWAPLPMSYQQTMNGH